MVLLGLAYAVAGIGLFYSLAAESMDLFTGLRVAILTVILLSLGVITRNEGLVTAENKLIGLFVLIAMGLLIGLTTMTDLSIEVVMAVVIAVGVILPGLLRRHTDSGTEQ